MMQKTMMPKTLIPEKMMFETEIGFMQHAVTRPQAGDFRRGRKALSPQFRIT